MKENQIIDDKEPATFAPGNASNPPANGEEGAPDSNNQLLSKKAEKYLREAGNIEDMPDEDDWQEADKVKKENKV